MSGGGMDPADLAALFRSTYPSIGGSDIGGNVSEGGTTTYGSELGTSTYGEHDLAAWDRSPKLAEWLADRLGISGTTGGEVSVWEVGEHKLRVSLWLGPDHRHVLWIHSGLPTSYRSPLDTARRTLALHEAYAAHVRGKFAALGKPEARRWKLRLLVGAGLVEPADVGDLVMLPQDAPASAGETWCVLRHVLSIRRLEEPKEEPFAFSAPWVAEWSGLAESTVCSGKRWLEERGYLVRAGTARGQFGKPTQLWHVRSPTP